MMFALPLFWLYSCLSQSTGPMSTASMRGEPGAHCAADHDLNASAKTVVAASSVTQRELAFCSEYPTQGLGQEIGLPQSPVCFGTQTVPAGPPPQVLVRQYADA